MKIRAYALLIVIAIGACALLAAHQHKAFEMRIDAQSPGVWPQYAAIPARQGEFIEMRVCHRVFLPRHHPKRITYT